MVEPEIFDLVGTYLVPMRKKHLVNHTKLCFFFKRKNTESKCSSYLI